MPLLRPSSMVLALALVCPSAALAEGGSGTVGQLRLSRQLVEYGRERGDPLSLIVAARMRIAVGARAVERAAEPEQIAPEEAVVESDEAGDVAATVEDTAEEIGGARGLGAPEPADEGAITVEGLLAEAEQYSGGEPNVMALVAATRMAAEAATRGRVQGPAYSESLLKGSAAESYGGIRFKAGQMAEIYAEGSGKTNIDLFIYDAKGRLLCKDVDPSDMGYCGWTPKTKGDVAVKVKIVNKGKRSSRYSLVTN